MFRHSLFLALALPAIGGGLFAQEFATPYITQLDPGSVTAGAGATTVHIVGSYLDECTRILFNGQQLPTSMGDGHLIVTIPANRLTAPGDYPFVAVGYQRYGEGSCATTGPLDSPPYSFYVISQQLQITTAPTLPSATVSVGYTTTLAATGGYPPIRFRAASPGDLPPGLTLAANGVLSGTPTVPGSYSFQVIAEDSCPSGETPYCVADSAQRTFTLNAAVPPVTVLTSTLPDGVVGQGYTQQLTAQSTLTPISWSVTSGALPPGLALGANGVLTGVPSTSGVFSFQLTARNAAGGSANRSFRVQIIDPVRITTDTLPVGTVSQLYATTILALGGVVPYRFQSTGLPAGLTMDLFGAVTGTPQVSGVFQVTVTVSDASNLTASRTFTLNVAPALEFFTTSLPQGTVGTLYNQMVNARGGHPPYAWTLMGGSNLPPGISLNPQTGQLLGTPTAAGNFTLRIRITDQGNGAVERTLQLAIRSNLSITTDSLPAGTVNEPFSVTFTASGGSGQVQWSLAEGSLPAGLTLNSSTGILSGTPLSSGEFGFTLLARDSFGSEARRSFALTVFVPLRITPETLPPAETGVTYTQTLSTSDPERTVNWSVAQGALPDGLQLESAGPTARITGVPSRAGRFSFTVRAGGGRGPAATQTYSIVVAAQLQITTSSLPAATPGQSYTATLAAQGGDQPYTWGIRSGSLPPEIQLDVNGGFSGAATRVGTFQIVAEVRDAVGRVASRALTLTVNPITLTINPASLPGGTVGVGYRQALSVDSSSEVTWQVTSGALPQGLTLSADGVVQGVPRQAGTSAFTIRASGTLESSGTRNYSITIADLNLPGFTITPTSADPGQQPVVGVSLSSPAPVDLQGLVRLAFVSDAGPGDPSVRFSTGSGDTVGFTIPAGQRDVQFPSGLAIQTGTVAGTITLSLEVTSNGVNVTPAPTPTRTIRIEAAAPVINNVTVTRTGSGLQVDVTAFSTAREVTSGEFQFTVNGQPGTPIVVPLTQVVSAWYASAQSAEFGSLFRLSIPFTLSGGPGQISQVSVTLVNSVGRSAPRTASVP